MKGFMLALLSACKCVPFFRCWSKTLQHLLIVVYHFHSKLFMWWLKLYITHQFFRLYQDILMQKFIQQFRSKKLHVLKPIYQLWLRVTWVQTQEHLTLSDISHFLKCYVTDACYVLSHISCFLKCYVIHKMYLNTNVTESTVLFFTLAWICMSHSSVWCSHNAIYNVLLKCMLDFVCISIFMPHWKWKTFSAAVVHTFKILSVQHLHNYKMDLCQSVCMWRRDFTRCHFW